MSQHVAPGFKVVHTQSKLSPIGPVDRAEIDIGPIENRITYINNLPMDITVVERTGFRHIVPCTTNLMSQSFIVRHEIKIRNDSVTELRKFLCLVNTDNNQDLTIIKSRFLDKPTNQYIHGFKVYLDYDITLEVLRQNEGSIYCKPRDVIVSTLSIYNAPDHPYSEDSANSNLMLFDDRKEFNATTPIYKIEIVDNNNQIGKRFVFILGEIKELIPRVDEMRQSGIYITVNQKCLLSESGFKLVQKKYDFDQAEAELGIFKSREEATSAGDLKQARKEELARLEHDNLLLKQDLQSSKALLDAELAKVEHARKLKENDYQEAINKLEREKAEIEHFRQLEREQRKDYYDARSTERKDSSELIKFLPMLILSIGAVVVAFNKLNAKQS